MESIKRSVMVLKSDSAGHMDQKNQAVLKLQSTLKGLAVDLSAPSLSIQNLGLYLFDKDGRDHFAGEISEARLQTTLSAISLPSVAGAAVIDRDKLTFCLKSTGPDWTDIAARFKFAHTAPLPAQKAAEQATQDATPPTPKTTEHTAQDAAPPPEDPPATDVQETAEVNENTGEQDQEPSDDTGVCDTCPHVIRQDKINPFPSSFPNSEWVKISYPGPTGWWHYISGKVRSGDTVIAKVLGVPGEYGMAPPIWLEGFGTYMRCVTPDAGGYWLMFQDAETGEVLDMGLSPRGE